MNANPVVRLKDVSPGMEVWWDTSPLLYGEWLQGPGREFAAAGLFALEPGDTARPRFSAASVLDGATTNQPLTWQVLEKQGPEWAAWLESNASGADPREAMWRVFVEVAAAGADRLAPIFEASGRRMGQICCQVDPRDLCDVDAMVAQARRIHAARPNIMVKMPGTQEGIEGVRILTAEGIPTNVTLGFTVAQLLAVGEAAKAGLADAEANGADLRNWRSCAVMMLGRYEDHPVFREQAQARGIELTDADLRWAGIAIFRKAHRLFRERGYPSKLMAASMRLGPTVDGIQRVWHLEKLAGADAVLTVFPNIFEAFLRAYRDLPLPSVVDEPVPPATLEKNSRPFPTLPRRTRKTVSPPQTSRSTPRCERRRPASQKRWRRSKRSPAR
ncbi:MAG: transaldolase family protein [Anaerolineae bacterium]|nr:transaldolase family protein [Anaerolineae bacterium]